MTLKENYSFLILLLCTISGLNASNILCIFPTSSPSHLITAQSLMSGLAERGHNVTVVSSYPIKKVIKNYREVYVPYSDLHREIAAQIVGTKDKKLGFISSFFDLTQKTLQMTNETLNDPQFRKIMETESFDLVIIGAFMNHYYFGLGAHFKCPIAVLSVTPPLHYINNLIGNPQAIAYVPHAFYAITGPLTFVQRLINFLLVFPEVILGRWILSLNEELYNVHFPQPKYPTFNEIIKNVSLVLINCHFSQSHARPYVPAMIEIGGIQIKEKPDPLPDDIRQWIENSSDGAILFSMGSNIRSSDLPPHELNIFLSAFASLKQNILWKFDDDTLKNLPKNIKISKWLPQDDILAHPNLKLFITHGGMGSITESKFHGVPIVGIPMFADQIGNIYTAANEGWAVSLEFKNITVESLSNAINDVLNNRTYRDTVQRLSILYRDRPATAMDTATFWIEYVIRHQGAKHLQANSVHLNFFQLHSIDVVTFLLVIGFVILLIDYYVLKCLFKMCCKSNKKKVE